MNKNEIESSIKMIEETLSAIKGSISSTDDIIEAVNVAEDVIDDTYLHNDSVLLSKQVTSFVGKEASTYLSKFFCHKEGLKNKLTMTLLNKICSNKNQKNNVMMLVELIKKGLVVENELRFGTLFRIINARFIHQSLPAKFADRWAFSENSSKLFKLLLDDAAVLYRIGEEVKGIDNNSERLFKCEELWRYYVASEKKDDNTYSVNAVNNETVEQYRELQQNEQRIVICGKQFWPVKQFDFNQNPERTYSVVWGAGTFIEQLIGLLLSKGDTIESVVVWLMQNSRSLRLMTKEGAAVFHSMVSAIKAHPELFKDNRETTLPVTTSAPECYFQ